MSHPDLKLPQVYRPVLDTEWLEDVAARVRPHYEDDLEMVKPARLRMNLLRIKEIYRIRELGSRAIRNLRTYVNEELPPTITEELLVDVHSTPAVFTAQLGNKKYTAVIAMTIAPPQELQRERASIRIGVERAAGRDLLGQSHFNWEIVLAHITHRHRYDYAPIRENFGPHLPSVLSLAPAVIDA